MTATMFNGKPAYRVGGMAHFACEVDAWGYGGATIGVTVGMRGENAIESFSLERLNSSGNEDETFHRAINFLLVHGLTCCVQYRPFHSGYRMHATGIVTSYDPYSIGMHDFKRGDLSLSRSMIDSVVVYNPSRKPPVGNEPQADSGQAAQTNQSQSSQAQPSHAQSSQADASAPEPWSLRDKIRKFNDFMATFSKRMDEAVEKYRANRAKVVEALQVAFTAFDPGDDDCVPYATVIVNPGEVFIWENPIKEGQCSWWATKLPSDKPRTLRINYATGTVAEVDDKPEPAIVAAKEEAAA